MIDLPMRPLLRRLRNHFLRGLLILLPTFATVYISYYLFGFMFRLLGFGAILVPKAYGSVPYLRVAITFGIELGTIAVTLSVICLMGWGIRTIVGREIGKWFRSLILTLPLVRSIYKGFEQLLPLFFANPSQSFSKVVLVSFPSPDSRAIGFITADAPKFLETKGDPDTYMIFIPGTPNPTSGFLLTVPKSEVMVTSLTVEQGLKLAISGGILEGEPQVLRRRRRRTALSLPAIRSVVSAMPSNVEKGPQ